MSNYNDRRSFLKKVSLSGFATLASGIPVAEPALRDEARTIPGLEPNDNKNKRDFNGVYRDQYLSRVAFPIGGLGAGMFCLEGNGAISHMSVNNQPEIFFEPNVFAALTIKSNNNVARVLEGPVPVWKVFGQRGSGNGSALTNYGLPRFESADFIARFPFGSIELKDSKIPLRVKVDGWSPFIPGDEDNSGLPVGALEYHFENASDKTVDAVFSFNTTNFIARGEKSRIRKLNSNGLILSREPGKNKPYTKSDFSISVFADEEPVIDYCWFRGNWFDALTMIWGTIESGELKNNPPVDWDSPGASIFVPLSVSAGTTKTVRVVMAWYTPDSNLSIQSVDKNNQKDPAAGPCCITPLNSGLESYPDLSSDKYKPWYSSRFPNVEAVSDYWQRNYESLKKKSALFRDAFYGSSLPPEVMEAVSANLTILKSPTVLRQYNGRFWAWEGCHDEVGCCHGTCTHVWNYAQALCHLFPNLEKGMRNTEFCEDQNLEGHQNFRANLPITATSHDFHSASDGQLGGIMKVYREWRISGDNEWLRKIYPVVIQSLDYCIKTWDPHRKGVLEEPHHNTYDIEFWGPDSMCTTFYLGALQAIIEMGNFLKQDIKQYQELLQRGKTYLEQNLFNGEFFHQQIRWKGLKAPDPAATQSLGTGYSPEALKILQEEGPRYQYGKGCLSDGVLGSWIATVCGLNDPVNAEKIVSHLLSVYKYNLKKDLREHVNPQRPTYAVGKEGGLLLCTWPKGDKLSLPFIYSNEVWTGIEYQVASHLMLHGKVNEGLEIVRTCRKRYDGRIRNPFNEYECGHWYARAMSSFALIQGLTGLRYDAVDKVLYVNSKIGDFNCFISTAGGFGTVTLKGKTVHLDVKSGEIEVKRIELKR